MAVPLFLLPALILLFFPLPQSTTSDPQIDVPICGDQNDRRSLICQLELNKYRINLLESALEEHINDLSAKFSRLSQLEKRIDEMNHVIHDLQSKVSSSKDNITKAEEKIKMLEEEVRHLWALLRKNNFELHNLKSKAQESDENLDGFASKMEKMTDIVNEQWIQLRQLQQALEITKMRVSKVLREMRPSCSFLNYVENLFEPYSSELRYLISEAWNFLQGTLSAAKRHHHQFQGIIKKEMEKNFVTASLAENHEVVFFVASAIITFPLIIAWKSLSPKFSSSG